MIDLKELWLAIKEYLIMRIKTEIKVWNAIFGKVDPYA